MLSKKQWKSSPEKSKKGICQGLIGMTNERTRLKQKKKNHDSHHGNTRNQTVRTAKIVMTESQI